MMTKGSKDSVSQDKPLPETNELAGSVIAVIGIITIISAVILFLPIIVLQGHATPIPYFGPLDHTYNLTIENRSYPIKYGFSEGNSAMVESLYANISSKSITVMINDNSVTTNGNRSLVYFVIELPRNIINANTTEIAGGCSYYSPTNNTIFWKQEHDVDYNIAVTTLSESNTATYSGNQAELCGPDSRTLSIEYPTGGKSMIVIQGTTIAPEFGSSVILAIVVVSMISGVLAMQRFWHFKAK